ncbi:MAG: Ppx/GppA phosphatase family protein [Pseudomonadota bacterium]
MIQRTVSKSGLSKATPNREAKRDTPASGQAGHPTPRKTGRGRAGPAFGALDLGTNNCRLLIARPSRGGFRVVDAYSRIVRLGEGLTSNGALSDAAVARTMKALRACSEKLRYHGVKSVRAVATEACRRAENQADLLARAKAETGIELEVISNWEEVCLAADSCASLLDHSKSDALIIDIGGGSTEISWLTLRGEGDVDPSGRRHQVREWCSLPFGVVSLAERYGGREVSREAYEAMVAEVEAAARPFEQAHHLEQRARAGEIQIIGTSGTVTTLAGVHKRLRRYDRNQVDGSYLDRATVAAICRSIVAMDYRARERHGCIGRDRADLVIAGCAILEGLYRLWPAPGLHVADRGLREGILMTLMREHRAEGREPAESRPAGPAPTEASLAEPGQ